MKKQVIVALALSVSMFSFAQKKELKTAEKAIKNNNFSEAKSALSQAESKLSGMDAKTKSKFYFLKGKALYANGTGTDADISKSIESLDMASQGNYASDVAKIKKDMENTLLTKANGFFQSKDFAAAEKGFGNLYQVVPSDTTYLFYAAVSAVSAKDYDSALTHYLKLNDLGYTGQETQYFATNKVTDEEEILSKDERDKYIKIGTHKNPGERKTESRRAEIVKNIAFIYINQGKNDEALAAIKNARAVDPNDVNLILSEANIQYKIGNNDAYSALIEQAIKLDPTNVDLVFNLGVVSANNGDAEKAKEYYGKAIELDPNYINAQTNMAALILDEEKAIIEEMNGLGTSSADNKKYDELKAKRVDVYREAIPYLESVMRIDPKNLDVAKTLMNIFSAIDDTAKFDEMKALVKSLSGQN